MGLTTKDPDARPTCGWCHPSLPPAPIPLHQPAFVCVLLGLWGSPSPARHPELFSRSSAPLSSQLAGALMMLRPDSIPNIQ